MSNTNNNLQTQTSNALHNAIMEAGGIDRPPMLAPGIDNDIYSTVDACPNACEMWKAIERLKQGESINVQDLETNLYWEFRKFTRDGESLELCYSKFYKMMNELSQELKTVSYHKLYDILKQHQNEVNELRAERLAQPEMVAEDDALSKEKEIDKLMALIYLSFKKIYKPTNNNLRTSLNTSRANQDTTPRINRGTGYDNQRTVNVVGARENVAYHKEKMLLCKQNEAGFQLNAEQADWRDNTDDDKPDDHELEAHYIYTTQIQEVSPDAVDNSGPIFDTESLQKVQNDNDNYNVFANHREHLVQPESINDTYLEEQGDTNITIDLMDMSTNGETVDQDDDDLAREREIEDFKTKNKSLESSNNYFKEANSELSKTNQLMFKDLEKFQAKLDRYHDVNYASKVEIDCAKAKGDLVSYKMESQKSFNEYTRKINDLNQMISEMKKELFAHQETISIMPQ
ncbi:hypothetical protein Tco_1145582 [Tanacetum coccineum]